MPEEYEGGSRSKCGIYFIILECYLQGCHPEPVEGSPESEGCT